MKERTSRVSGPFGKIAASPLWPWIVRLTPFAIFAGLAIALTYPFIVSPNSTVTAPVGFDVTGSIAKYHAIVAEGTTPFSGGRLQTMAWPVGYPTTPTLDTASAFSSGSIWVGTLLFGAIPAHGLLVLLGYVLTASTTFLFVRRITGSAGAGFVSGIALGFFSHMQLLARAAPTYMHLWLYVLPIWGFTELVLRPTRRRALLAGGSLIPALFWTPYFTEHVLIAAGACVAVAVLLLYHQRRTTSVARIAMWAVTPILASTVLYVLIGLTGGSEDIPDRDPRDSYIQSAHPLMYLLPGYFSSWGGSLADLTASLVPRAAGTNLYLGMSTLVLAGLGVTGLLWDARRRNHDGAGSGTQRPLVAAALLAGAVAFAAVAFSGPPTISILGASVPTPAKLPATFVPALRAGQRFVMLAMPGIAVLAGIGVARMLRNHGIARRALIAGAVSTVVFLDFSVSTQRVGNVPGSVALEALHTEPPGPTVHYMEGTFLAGATLRPCVFQSQHGKTLVNSCSTSFFHPILREIDDYRSCAVLRSLEPRGIRYVIVDFGLTVFAECPDGNQLIPIESDEHFSVYRVASNPAGSTGTPG